MVVAGSQSPDREPLSRRSRQLLLHSCSRSFGYLGSWSFPYWISKLERLWKYSLLEKIKEFTTKTRRKTIFLIQYIENFVFFVPSWRKMFLA